MKWETTIHLLFWLVFITTLIALVWILAIHRIAWKDKIGVSEANINRGIIEESEPSKKEMRTMLAIYFHEYNTNIDPLIRESIRDTVRTQYAGYKEDLLPQILKDFLKQMRGY